MTRSRADLVALDRRHVWRPFASTEDHETRDPLVVTHAEGIRLTDADGTVRELPNRTHHDWAAAHNEALRVLGDPRRLVGVPTDDWEEPLFVICDPAGAADRPTHICVSKLDAQQVLFRTAVLLLPPISAISRVKNDTILPNRPPH